jgi:hypothetical protein
MNSFYRMGFSNQQVRDKVQSSFELSSCLELHA